MKALELEQMEMIEGGSLSLKEGAACVLSTGLWGYAMVGFVMTGVGAGVVVLSGAAIALGCILD